MICTRCGIDDTCSYLTGSGEDICGYCRESDLRIIRHLRKVWKDRDDRGQKSESLGFADALSISCLYGDDSGLSEKLGDAGGDNERVQGG